MTARDMPRQRVPMWLALLVIVVLSPLAAVGAAAIVARVW